MINMIKKIEFEAKTLKEAKQYAAKELQANIDNIQIEVIKEKKGFLGIGGITTFQATTEINLLEEGKKYLESILNGLDVEYQMEARTANDELNYSIESQDNPLLIGREGRCLDALLTLLKVYINKISQEKKIITLDIGGYRANRKRQLEVLATKTAKEVARTRIEVKLKPMNAFERKIIHEKLSEWRDVYTESEGEGENRCLVIKPNKN